MNPSILERIIRVLDRNCLWLDLLPMDDFIYYDPINPTNSPFVCKCIRLFVKRPRRGFRRGQILKLPIRQIDDAIHDLNSDLRFKIRCEKGLISVNDVEEIFKKATYGTLRLDLFEY